MPKQSQRLSKVQKIGVLLGSVFLFCCGCLFLIILLPTPDRNESSVEVASEVIETETTLAQLGTLGENEPEETATPEVIGETPKNTRVSEPTASRTAAPTSTLRPSNTPEPNEPVEPEVMIGSITLESGEEIVGETAAVTRVIDGDTIEVTLNGAVYRVRYIGMDTPERGDTFFDEATEANRLLVENQTVIMVKDVSETDRFGRLLRYIYLQDGTFVNAELVKQGFALIATFPPDVAHQAEFVALQEEARTLERGLWGGVAVAAITNTPLPLPTSTVAPQPSNTAVPEPVDTPIPQPTSTLAPLSTNTAVPEPVDTPIPQPTSTPAPLPTNTPEPQPAPGNVVISSIFYDGVVPRVESDEYAVITNQGGSPVNLAGWRLNAGDPGQDFVFPDYVLQPGQSCRVYTNQIHPETCGFSFGRGQAIWNNDGDCGYLYDAGGGQVSQYCY